MCSPLLPNLTFPHAVPQSLLILPCTLPLLSLSLSLDCAWSLARIRGMTTQIAAWVVSPPSPHTHSVPLCRIHACGLWGTCAGVRLMAVQLIELLIYGLQVFTTFLPITLFPSPSLSRFIATRWSNKSSNCPPLEETRPVRVCAPATTFKWHRSESSLVLTVVVISVHFIRSFTFTESL